MEKDKLLKRKERELKKLEKIFVSQSAVLGYYKLKPRKNLKDNLPEKIKLLKEEITILEKEVKYEYLKNSTSNHSQSFSNFSKEDQQKLIEYLKMIKEGKCEKKSTKRTDVVIDEKTIEMREDNGWEDIAITILYNDLEKIETYQLASYFYDYDWASDPPFESRPAETQGNLGGSLSYLFDACEKILGK